MGCFDYECECGGSKCVFTGGQDGGGSDVVIEVPLKDGTTVYLKGFYNSYGTVHIGEYQFYLEQFEEFFNSWLERETEEARSKIFFAKRIWTVTCYRYSVRSGTNYKKNTTCCPTDITIISNPEKDIYEKCIRADSDLEILSDAEKQKYRIASLKSKIELLQEELGRTLRP